jgi:hypothetical protein
MPCFFFFARSAGFVGPYGPEDDLVDFGVGSAEMLAAAPAPLLLVPKKHKPPGGDGGGHSLRNVFEVLMPGDNSCIYHALDYGGEGLGANALRQRTADFVRDQYEYKIEGVPLEDWVKWDSGKTPGAYAKAMRSPSKWGGGIELAVNSIEEQCNVFVYEKIPEEPGAYRCISRFEFPGALKTKHLLYCGRNHYNAIKTNAVIMPKAGDKVAVELREGFGCRADLGREAYEGVVVSVSSAGYTIRHSLTHRDRTNVEPSRVNFLETKTPAVVARRELNVAVEAAEAAQQQLRAQEAAAEERLRAQEAAAAERLRAQEAKAEERLRVQEAKAAEQLRAQEAAAAEKQREKDEAAAVRLAKERQKVQQQKKLADASARATKYAEDLLRAGQARANAEVTALMNDFAARADEQADEQTKALQAKMSQVERAAASAKKRQVLDFQNLEEKHRVQASRLLNHTSGEQGRLKQSHLDNLESQRVANEKEFALLRKQHAEELDEHDSECHGLLGAAKALLSRDELEEFNRVPSVGKLGENSASVAEMGKRRQSDLGKVTSMLMEALLRQTKAGKKLDPVGTLKSTSGRRDSATSTLGQVLGEQTKVEVPPVLAKAYIFAVQSNMKEVAKQHLSVVVKMVGVTEEQAMKACTTERKALSVGDEVDVVMSGNKMAKGKVEAVLAGEVIVTGVGTVDAERVWARGAVRCTQYQIREAKLHAAAAFPGAPVAKSVNGHYGIDPQRAAVVAAFLRDPSVVQVVEASLANSSKGVKYRLKARRFRLWKRLVEQMEKAELTPISWGYFWMLTADRQYELLTVDNCCCATCRDLGFVNYNEMRSIVAVMDAAFLRATNGTTSLPGKAELVQRIDKEEEFRRGLFQTHLKPEDSCGSHCRTNLLSTHCNPNFRKPCTHGCVDGGVPPKDMYELLGRKPRAADYPSLC